MATAYFNRVLRHAEQRLLEQGGQRKPTDLLEVYRKFIKLEETQLRQVHKQGMGGRELCRRRADLVTVLLQHVWKSAVQHVLRTHKHDPSGDVAMIAVGGFGRGELNPMSDVDLLFLYRKTASGTKLVNEAVEQVLYMLWDSGFKVGHAVRTQKEVVDQANADLQSKTALLEARYLCGDKELWAQFERSFERLCISGKEEEYINWRRDDQAARHSKVGGGTVFLQEPNVKQGCGGLRDYQNLLWVARVKRGLTSTLALQEAKLLTPSERKQLEAGYDFILRIRSELHWVQGRGGDQLTLRLQGQVATALGYPQTTILRRTEAMMREYYGHTRCIYVIANTLARRLSGAPKEAAPRWSFLPWQATEPTRVDGFIVREGEIEIEEASLLTENPLLIVRAFLLAQQFDAQLGPQLTLRLRRRAHLLQRRFLYRPEVREMLLAILSRRGSVERILRRMHEVGLLGKLFPEFEPLTCLVQHEFFHRYTADEHTLVCIGMLDRIVDAQEQPFSKYKDLLHNLPRPHILYLAMLLHDTGKSANSKHHSDESAANAVRVARRLKLSGDDLSALVFLVDHHMTMMETSRRKNLDDDETILAFARLVRRKEWLDMLMLLTFADSEGTSGSHAWSDWKELLLWQLYRRTEGVLTHGREFLEAEQHSQEELQARVAAALAREVSPQEVEAHFSMLPARYFNTLSESMIVHHARVVHRFLRERIAEEKEALEPVVAWRNFPQQGFSEVVIVTWDRERLFAKICGTFAAVGLSIMGADIATRADNIVIDTFRVSSLYTGVIQERDQKQFDKLLSQVFQQTHFDFHELFAEQRSKRTLPYEEADFPTKVECDNRSSSEFTLLHLRTPDRPGVLYQTTNTLATLGIDIGFARIITEKGAALDTFYVTDADGQKLSDVLLDRVVHEIVVALAELE